MAWLSQCESAAAAVVAAFFFDVADAAFYHINFMDTHIHILILSIYVRNFITAICRIHACTEFFKQIK